MTKDQAMLIVDAHEIISLMDDEEEAELLLMHNPDLYYAYEALLLLAEDEDE